MAYRPCHLPLLMALIGASWVPAAAQPPVNIEQVARAFKQRQSQIQSFSFRWKGSSLWVEGREPISDPKTGKSLMFPEADTITNGEYELTVQGQGARYVIQGPTIDLYSPSFVDRTYVAVADGTAQRNLYTGGTSPVFGPLHPLGFGGHADQFSARDLAILLPLWLHFQPLDDVKLNPLDSYRINNEIEVIDGHKCVVIHRDNPISQDFWLDLDREFSILRYRNVRPSGDVRFQLDVDYQPDPTLGWVPSAWKIISYQRDGTLFSDERHQVTSYEINKPIPKSSFHIEWPVGAMVSDTDGYYILREDGKKRPILDSEQRWGITYAELINTEPGHASILPQKPRYWLYAAIASLGLALIMSTLFVLRYRRGNR